jgi:membrane protein implicated in regulation of membrane protease activity
MIAPPWHDGGVPAWLIWLIISGALAVAEMSSLTLVLLMLAGGAGAGAVAAAVGAPVFLQLVVALVVTAALLGLVRPIARRHMIPTDPAITGVDQLLGMEAIVVSKVDARDGRVLLNGSEWSARAYDREQELPAGTVVRVMQIQGATALVWQDTA